MTRSTLITSQAGGLKGWSLIEVLVSVAVLLAGVVAIAMYFPISIGAKADAGYLAKAALLAQAKAQEVRRDDDAASTQISDIKASVTPTAPLAFPDEPNLSYQFCGTSLIDPFDDPGDPRDDAGVARVIVRFSADFRPSQKVIYELRFDR